MADPFVPITQPTTTTTLPSPSAAPSNSTTTTSGQKRALDMETTKPRSSKSCKTDPYRHLGRHFVRTIELTVDPYTIIKEGVKRVADTQNEFRPNYTIAEDRNYAAFMALGRHINTLLHDVYGNPKAQQEVAQSIRDGASGARSDDTSEMKRDLLDWIKDSLAASRMPLHPKNMLNRGHHHPDTSRLLAPAVLGPWNPAMQQALVTGTAKINERPVTPSDWPAFIYAGQFNPHAPMEGLLRGPLLVTAYRMVFISPTSASFDTSEGRGTRSGNAALHGMTSVNDASIAYVAAQLFFSLSSKATFTKNKDNGAIEFYNSLRAFFGDPDFKVDIEELLQWWNEQIFPNAIIIGDNSVGANHHLALLKNARAGNV